MKQGKFAAKVLTLKGDRSTPESAQHIIKFPGGSVELTRTTDGEYWVHVEVKLFNAGLIRVENVQFDEVVEA